MKYFLQGLTMGLAYVAPIGLQNLFVINSALTHTRKRALLTALIVIFFDVTLALACFFGVGAVMQRYEWLQMAPCVRVRIEGAEGQSLSLNDVTANTKWVGDVIEELDPISSSYTLEVSSPGMARPLRRPCDFARFVGENCELTSTATEGRRKYAGKIAAATETDVTLELENGESVTLDFSDVKKCKLKPTYDFKPAKEGK